VSDEVRTAVVRMTDVMRERLIDFPTKIPDPSFSIRDSHYPKWSIGRSYLCLLADNGRTENQKVIAGIARVIPGKADGDYERGATITDFIRITPQVEIARLRTRLGQQFADAANEGPASSEARARRLIEVLRAEVPRLNDEIDALISKISRRLPDGHAGEIRAHEKDVVNSLLRAFGHDHEILRDAGFVSRDAPFLSALPDETRMINHDADHFRDWFVRDPDPLVPGVKIAVEPALEVASFRSGKSELLIYNANNGHAEDITGVDLIYYNVHERCFVMVQYKKFKIEIDGPVVRPDNRLNSQLARMRDIDDQCKPGADALDIRLHPKPCFLKLCMKEDPAVDSLDMIKGFYLSREHFETVLNSPAGRGPRGGKRIGAMTSPRHLDNEMFTRLLAYGWIGSCGVGTEFVREQVWNSLQQRGSVIFGTHVGDRPLGNGYSQLRDNSGG
jgi:hypothetical protein